MDNIPDYLPMALFLSILVVLLPSINVGPIVIIAKGRLNVNFVGSINESLFFLTFLK